MHRATLLALILLLAFVGIADAWYLAESALSDTALTCGIGVIDGCNVVAQSDYSYLFGIPLGIYGVLFYTLVVLFAALVLVLPRTRTILLLASTTLVGLLFSLYFLALQVFVIKALCIYCLLSVGISLVLAVLAGILWKRFAPVHTHVDSV